MTDTPSTSAVTVTQADREAAGDLCDLKKGYAVSGAIRRGDNDDGPTVQAFASHRIASQSASVAGVGSAPNQPAASPSVEAGREGVERLATFGAKLFDHLFERFCEGEWEVEINDLIVIDAVNAGLVDAVDFDPEEHIDVNGACMPGDPYYIISSAGQLARDVSRGRAALATIRQPEADTGVREALEQAHALIQEAKGLAGPGSVTDHLDFAEHWLGKLDTALATPSHEAERTGV